MFERKFKTDVFQIDASRVETRHDEIHGPVTIFKNVVIARAIVHEYDDGLAYKPGKELENAYWTADNMWATSKGHPATAIISTRDEIHGRTVNVRFSKSLKDPKTERPMNRGILADLEVFDNKVPPDLLKDMKNGRKTDVSIGFFFDHDGTAGIVEDEEDQALKGAKYDYVQRNITINHLAFGIDVGRCPMPYCGIGADGKIREATGDPFAGYRDFADCVAKNQDKDDPEAYCASIERKIEEARKKKDESTEGGDAGPRTEAERVMAHFGLSEEEWEQLSEEEKKDYISRLPERGSANVKDTIDRVKAGIAEALSQLDNLVEEEYQGNLTNMTATERAKRYFNINDEEWLALTEKEKEDYISRLPAEKTQTGGEEMSEKDCSYEWEGVRDQILSLKKFEPTSLSKLLGDMAFEDDKVTITQDARAQLAELGVELEECDQGDAGPRSEAERAMAHFNISPEDWAKLSDEEKQEYIGKLPERRGEGEETDESEVSIWVDAWIRENVGEDAALSYAQKKALPDSAYAYIEAGCKKEDGKTEQKCRHLLIHDKAHVQAALAALGGARTGKVPPYASKAKGKVCAAAKKFGIESEVCGTKKKKDEIERARELLKDLT